MVTTVIRWFGARVTHVLNNSNCQIIIQSNKNQIIKFNIQLDVYIVSTRLVLSDISIASVYFLITT